MRKRDGRWRHKPGAWSRTVEGRGVPTGRKRANGVQQRITQTFTNPDGSFNILGGALVLVAVLLGIFALTRIFGNPDMGCDPGYHEVEVMEGFGANTSECVADSSVP